MGFHFTSTQKQRLTELDADEEMAMRIFNTKEERDLTFRKIHHRLTAKARDRLQRLREHTLRPAIRSIESKLVETLNGAGFADYRAKEAHLSGAEVIVTACSRCNKMLNNGFNNLHFDNIKAVDLAQIVYNAVDR